MKETLAISGLCSLKTGSKEGHLEFSCNISVFVQSKKETISIDLESISVEIAYRIRDIDFFENF